MHVRRELIKISESLLSEASEGREITSSGEEMIQRTEKSLFDLAERGHFNSLLKCIFKFHKRLIKVTSFS